MLLVVVQLFPFAIGIDKDMRMKYMGATFRSLFKQDVVGMLLSDAFTVVRPTFELTWTSVCYSNECETIRYSIHPTQTF